MIPNMVVMVPADGSELRLMTQFAYEHDGPIAMRYPRGNTTAWDESATEPIPVLRCTTVHLTVLQAPGS